MFNWLIFLCITNASDALEQFAASSPFYGTIALGKDGKLTKHFSKGPCKDSKNCTKNNLYSIGSITKQFTAVALLKAVLEIYCKNDVQKLSAALKEPLANFLKEWPQGKAPEWSKDVTLHHLLSNTSGLKDVEIPDYIEFGKKPRTREEVLNLYLEKNLKLSFKPGKQYEYSNPNFFIAGLVVEQLTGKTLGTYLKSTIFDKNKMPNTFLPEANMEELFKQYPLLAKGFMFSLKEKSSIYQTTVYFASTLNQGDGGIISTVEDLIQWNHVLWETENILPNAAKQIMLHPSGKTDESHYGYGIEVDGGFYSHEGLNPGYHSMMIYDPQKKTTLVELSNLSADIEQFIYIMSHQKANEALEEPEKTAKEDALEKEYPLAQEIYEAHKMVSSDLLEEPLVNVQEIKTKYQMPAVGVGFIIDGSPKGIAAAGFRKIGNDAKVTTNDKWHIGSCTKSMTATLAAILIDSRKYPALNWETKLEKFFDFKIHDDFKNITLKELLAHKSGIEDPTQWDDIEKLLSPLKTDAEKRAILAKNFLEKPASYNALNSKEGHYSNIGYVIVGAILEQITGKSWEELMKEEIFAPLQMESAGFGMPANEKAENPDQPWGHDEKDMPTLEDNASWIGPAGTVHVAIADWLKYLQVHLDGGRGLDTKILPASAFKILHAEISDNSDFSAGGFLTGNVDGMKVLQAIGSNSFNFAGVRLIPERNTAIVCLSNYTDDNQKPFDMFTDIMGQGMSLLK